MRISDWSSDVCSSDLAPDRERLPVDEDRARLIGVAAGAIRIIGDLHVVALAVDLRVGLRGLAAEAQGEIADRHHDRAELHRAFRAAILIGERSEERSVGKEWVSPCRSRWPPQHYNKQKPQSHNHST